VKDTTSKPKQYSILDFFLQSVSTCFLLGA